MRILTLTATYPPSINGVAISAHLLQSELEKRGHQLTLIAPRHPDAPPKQDILRLPSFPNPQVPDYPLPFPYPALLLSRKLKSGFDLVHFHHPFLIGNLALKLARLNNCPSVFTYHTQYARYAEIYSPKFLPRKLVPALVKRSLGGLIAKTTHLIAETDSLKAQLESDLIKTPVSVIPSIRPSMAVSTPKKLLRQKYQLDSKALILLCVARLSKEKNLDTLMRALPHLPKNLDWKLCLAGEGPEEKNLKALARHLGVLANCRFLGTIEFSRMPHIYSLADIFAYPATTDTQAAVVSEALSAGLPVVAFDTPGPRDFIVHGENGFLARNNEEFSRHLTKLITNKKLVKEMSNSALESSNKFSFTSTVNQTESLFKEIISRHQ